MFELPNINMKNKGKANPNTSALGLFNCPLKLALMMAPIAFHWLK
jgi:hypothetical protein